MADTRPGDDTPEPKRAKPDSPAQAPPTTMSQAGADDTQMALFVKRLSEAATLPVVEKQHPWLWHDLHSSSETVIPAKGKAIVPTDISIALPEGCYGRVAPRSGLAVKHFLDVGAGVIDADYRGAVGVVMFNFSDVDYKVHAKDRIAQLILERIITPPVTETDVLPDTARGAGGFGSTGKN